MRLLEGLQPEKVFYYFEEISNIPRGSYHEKAISDYLVEFAKAHGITYFQDELYNVVMQVSASKGRENDEPVILQGHMDMVCEARPGVDIDMEKEPLKLCVDGDYVYAKDTTLGGDDGIAVAYMLAIADDENISHPPLEYIITVSEEVGMEGANGIDLSMLKGHAMLNVDSEDEGVFTTSCAGGVSVHVTLPLDREDLSDDVSLVELSVSGLVGGHSGCEIDKGRANANKILGRALYELSEKVDFCIVKLWGGKKDNAIPIQANAIIGLSEDNAIKTLEDFLEKLNQELKKEYLKVDENITLFSKRIANIKSDTMSKAFTESSRDKIITYLMCVPNGIQNMSMSVPGLVETSLNLGILETKENHLFAQHSVRSSVSTRKEYVVKQLQSLAIALGGKVECKGDYPAWEYREDSKVRDRAVLLWKQMYGKEPVVEGIHAGLECGLLAAKIKNLDCISIGPDMNDIHTYNERLSISSTKRVYDFIVEFLNV
ncbi:MAG: aminoacyl-histidine dipeptidase [Lachnospiraceae bacterium]|nr:aminoacyl-histidine dipeptidase [Lachnospiraceae bacterium]